MLPALLLAQKDAPRPARPPSVPLSATAHYTGALEDLEKGRWPEAQAKLSSSANDFHHLLAYGVALTLGERLEEAVPILERCTKLQPTSAEADLWLFAAELMSGIVTEQHAYHIRPRGQERRLEGQPKIHNQREYAPEYASFVWQDMARAYAIAREGGAITPRIRNMMREAGQRFAAVQFGRPELATYRQAKQQTLQGQNRHGEALIAILKEGDFANPDWNLKLSGAFLALGRWPSARRHYTHSLENRPLAATGWLNRGIAAAQMGDEKRARADFARAQKLDSALGQRSRAQFEQSIARTALTPPQATAALEQSARAGEPLDRLIAKALVVQRATNARRVFYDETYLDRLTEFVDALRANPRAVDTAINFVHFLVTESDFATRSESVERQTESVAYRVAFDANRDLRSALVVADRALALAPQNPRALVAKSLVLDKLGRYAEAEPLVDRAAALAPHDPLAQRLKAEYLVAKRDRAYVHASGLRTNTMLGSRTYEEGDQKVTETTYRTPSQADLNRAAGLEQAGYQFNQNALATIREAIRLSQGTPEGPILSARYDFHNQRPDQALATLQQAVRQFPKSNLAWEALAKHYRWTRQYDAEDDANFAARNLLQTTAGPKLRKAWRLILRTDWPAAEAALAEAQAADPADARIHAYRAVMARERGQKREAAMYWMIALALEEARLSLDESEASVGVTRPPSSLALVLQLRYQLAARGTDALSAGIYRGAVTHALRIDKGDRGIVMWGGLLPDPLREKADQPGFKKDGAMLWPDNAATMAAEAHVGLAQALKAQGQRAEAKQQYEMAAEWTNAPRQVAPRQAGGSRDYAGGRAVGAGTEALLALTRMAIEEKDLPAARDYYQRAQNSGSTLDHSADMEKVAFELDGAQHGGKGRSGEDKQRPVIRIPRIPKPNIRMPRITLPRIEFPDKQKSPENKKPAP